MAEFGVLGPLTVMDDGRAVAVGGPRQRRLLAALLMRPGRVVSVDRLVEAVFDGRPSDRAEATLRSYATRLRRSLIPIGSDVVVREGVGYRLAVAPEDVDAGRFETDLAKARRLADYDSVSAAATLRSALAAWRGEAYAEFCDQMWAQPEVHRLADQRRAAEELLVDLEMQVGSPSAVVGTLRGLLAAEPFREGLVARLMMAQYRAGDPVDALVTYSQYRQRAGDELGIDPGPELDDLQRRVLARDPGLASPVERALRGYCLGELLGRGRLGTVLAARLPGVAREYAVRVYDDEFADDPRVIRSFEADVRAVSSIEHPALLPLHDAWREPGVAALVMRRMDGGTLADLLDAGTLDPQRAHRVLVRVAGALLALAGRGWVHGRVRASSVLLDRSGEAYLAEPVLGLAAPNHVSDAADLLALARACGPGSIASTDGTDWLDELASKPDLDVPTAATALLDGLRAAPPTPENPYVGLRAFDRGDAERFFGRDALVAQVVGRLTCGTATERLVLLVGGSGSGKSSVVRAGVLPALASAETPWASTVMMPGANPFRHLDEALARLRTSAESAGSTTLEPTDAEALARAADRIGTGDVPILLVIDQFEEMFTLTEPVERDRFLDALAAAVTCRGGRLHVVATLRADYFDRPLDHPTFAALASGSALAVPAMAPVELEQTITGPAAGRLSIDEGLVADLVASTSREPAALPALQFTLHELASRGVSALRWSDLAALGGVDGAIAQRAEQLYCSVGAAEQHLLRRLLTALVVIDANSEPSRRRVPRAELARFADDPAAVEALLESWVAARLLVGDRRADTREPTVEVAHEAILERWPRLRGWIQEDRERIRAIVRLEDAAAAWHDLDRDPAALLRGGRLEQVETLLNDRRASTRAREFVGASVAQRAAEERAAREGVARRERIALRLRRQRWMLASALVVALVVGGIAIDQSQTATRVAREASQRAEAATSALAAAAGEAAASDWSLGLLLAAQAHQINPSPSTRQALVQTIAVPRPSPTTVYTGEHSYRRVVVDPVTGIIAVRSTGGVVDLVDPDSGLRVGGIQALGDGGMDLYDGRLVVGSQAGDNGAVRELVDGETAQVVDLAPGVFATDVEFSPDGAQVAVSDTSGLVTVYDPTSWDQKDVVTGGQAAPIEQVAWVGGDELVAIDSEGEVMVWSVPGEVPSPRLPDRSRLLNETGGLGSAAVEERPEIGYSAVEMEQIPGTSFVLLAPMDRPPWFLRTTDLEMWHQVGFDLPRPSTVAAAEGARTYRADGSSWTWHSWVPPSKEGKLWPEPRPAISTAWDAADIAVAPTGEVVTAGTDGTVSVWDIPGAVPGATRRPSLDSAVLARVSADGRAAMHWGPGTEAWLADPATFEPRRALPLGEDAAVLGVAFQPDRSRVLVTYCPQPPHTDAATCDSETAAFGAADGSLAAGPVATGPQRNGVGSPVVAPSSGGIVATSDATGLVTLRDPATLEQRATLDDLAADLTTTQRVSLSLSPDDSLLLARPTVTTTRAVVWDVSGEAAAMAFTAEDIAEAGFASDGALLLVPMPGGATTKTQVIGGDDFAMIEQIETDAGVVPTSRGSGDLMVTASTDRGVWLWDGVGHRPLAQLDVTAAILRPDGEALLFWYEDRAHELSLDPDHLVATACAAARRNLTQQEWDRHLGADEPYRTTCPENPVEVRKPA